MNPNSGLDDANAQIIKDSGVVNNIDHVVIKVLIK